jgi:hypothetical protein
MGKVFGIKKRARGIEFGVWNGGAINTNVTRSLNGRFSKEGGRSSIDFLRKGPLIVLNSSR